MTVTIDWFCRACFVASCILAAAAANGQTTQGMLWGIVAGRTSATISTTSSATKVVPLKGASLTCTNVATGESRSASTGRAGTYYIVSLSPGEYVLKVEGGVKY